MRTTKQQFEHFKECATNWQQKLGLVNWALYFNHTKLDGKYGETIWSTRDMAATIQFAKDWDTFRPLNDDEINKLALHEVLHVLMAPLCSEAEYRYSTSEAIQSAEHAIIRALENVV